MLILILSLLAASMGATLIPASSSPVLEDSNCFSDFVRVDPDDSLPDALSTRIWLWQDDNDLVVYAEAQIDDKFEKGNYVRRDLGNSGDMLRVQLVTMPQAYMAYAYCMHPLGHLADGIRTQDMGIDYSWDSSYSYDTLVTDDLWRVTMRIPLGELRFKQEQPYQWRIIFTRYYKDDNSTYSSPYANVDQKNSYFSSSHPITLEHPIQKDLPVIIKPYFVKSYNLITHTDSFDPQNIGLDLAYLPSQKLRIKFSFNPDFSDVPMDDATDNYNDKYPPYYDENRFFFTEDLQVFDLGDNLYTRNIVQPQFAYKMTGNTGRVNWGLLGALDKEIRDDGDLINPDDYYQVLSIKPSWEDLSISGALISRINSGFYNHGFYGTMDYRILPWLSCYTEILAATQKAESEIDAHNDIKTKAQLAYDKGDFSASLAYNYVGPDLVHDAGYIYDNDYDGLSLDLSWDQIKPLDFISSKGINSFFSLGRSSLQKDEIDISSVFIYSYVNLKRKLMLQASLNAGTDVDLDMNTHQAWTFNTGFHYAPIRQFYIGARISRGESLIYSLGEVYDRTAIILNSGLKLARKLSLDYNALFSYYGYPRESQIEIAPGLFMPLILDNQYAIHNLGMVYTHSETFSLSGGLGLSTYERSGNYAELSYYTNLRYEFIPGSFLYLGFKSRQNQTEPSNLSNPLPHYRRDMASAYLKVAFTL